MYPFFHNSGTKIFSLLKRAKMPSIARLFFLPFVCIYFLTSCGSSDQARARRFVNEIAAWSQQLTHNGRKAGEMIYGLIRDDESDFSALRQHLKESNEFIASGIKDFSNRDLPLIAQDYRSIFIDYLRWQISSEEEVMPKAMAIAADKTLSRSVRAKKVSDLFETLKLQEQDWKARMKAAYDKSIR